MSILNVFSKKHLDGLQRARQLNLITELECLKLERERVDEKIKKHLEKHGGRKKKK